MNARFGTCFPFDRSRIYEIQLLGGADTRMFAWLAGTMDARLEHTNDPDNMVTVLTGRLSDQAALIGVLNALYDRGYTLTLVRQVPECTEPD